MYHVIPNAHSYLGNAIIACIVQLEGPPKYVYNMPKIMPDDGQGWD